MTRVLLIAAVLMLMWTGSEALLGCLAGHEDASGWAVRAVFAAIACGILANLPTS